jgi:molecular chaperone GrpE
MNTEESDLMPEDERLDAPVPDPLDDLSDPDFPDANADAVESEIESLTAELNEVKDHLLRTLADFQNFRKRAQQEKLATQKFATEQLILDLLPVLDNFERTNLAAAQGATTDSLLTGVQMVHKQLLNALEKRELKRISAIGAVFDSELHEAIGTEDTDEFPEDHVCAEIEAGYRIGDHTIRPARVKVAKKP